MLYMLDLCQFDWNIDVERFSLRGHMTSFRAREAEVKKATRRNSRGLPRMPQSFSQFGHPTVLATRPGHVQIWRLEVELETKLNGARAMGINGVKEGVAKQAIGAACGIHVAGGIEGATVAAGNVACGIAAIGIVEPELGVIENVEGFRAKLEGGGFAGLEVFQQGHIKVQAIRVVGRIAPDVAEGKPLRGSIFVGIEEQGAKSKWGLKTSQGQGN